MTEKSLKIPPRSPPRALRGPPRDPEIDQLFASGGARGPTNTLFWLPGPPPGAIWSLPGGRLGPTWRPEAPRRAPGLHFRPSGASLGSIFFDFHVFTRFSSCFTAQFGLPVRLRARLRALFGNLQVEKIKVESPGSLNPWVAAGGREAIRIN